MRRASSRRSDPSDRIPITRTLLVLAAALVAPAALAQDVAPDVLVKGVTQEVLAIIKQDKEIQAGNQKKTVALVEEKVLPHFNFTRMTALAMGPNWRKSSPEQQKALVEQAFGKYK